MTNTIEDRLAKIEAVLFGQSPPQLITLDEWNSKRSSHYRTQFNPHPNGIACPKCGSELIDSDPTLRLLSAPPKMHIHCETCDYKGYRIA